MIIMRTLDRCTAVWMGGTAYHLVSCALALGLPWITCTTCRRARVLVHVQFLPPYGKPSLISPSLPNPPASLPTSPLLPSPPDDDPGSPSPPLPSLVSPLSLEPPGPAST